VAVYVSLLQDVITSRKSVLELQALHLK